MLQSETQALYAYNSGKVKDATLLAAHHGGGDWRQGEGPYWRWFV